MSSPADRLLWQAPPDETPPNPWAQWLRRFPTERYSWTTKAGWDAFVNAGPRPAFDTLAREEMQSLDETEREDYDEARRVWNANLPIVRTPQLSAAFEVFSQVMASSYRDGDRLRGAVAIDSPGGLGKSTITAQFARDYHRAQYRRYGPATPQGHQRLPVAYVSLTGKITQKQLAQKLVRFYGHPAPDRLTEARMHDVLADMVTACETRIIVIDDLHFVDFRSRDGHAVSNHLKGLANLLPVTFFYVGINLHQRQFFSEGDDGPDAVYSQTARRTTRLPVRPFTISSDAGARAWNGLLTEFANHVKLADATPGMLTPLAAELFHRSQGNIGSLTAILDRACQIAMHTGTETINQDVLHLVRADSAAEHGAALS